MRSSDSRIGNYISTKAVGRFAREDITNQYKYNECKYTLLYFGVRFGSECYYGVRDFHYVLLFYLQSHKPCLIWMKWRICNCKISFGPNSWILATSAPLLLRSTNFYIFWKTFFSTHFHRHPRREGIVPERTQICPSYSWGGEKWKIRASSVQTGYTSNCGLWKGSAFLNPGNTVK